MLYYQVEKVSADYKNMKNGFASSDRHLEFNNLYFFYSLFLSIASVESELVQLKLQSEKNAAPSFVPRPLKVGERRR